MNGQRRKILLTGVGNNLGGTESVVQSIVKMLGDQYDFGILAATEKTVAYDSFFKKNGVSVHYVSNIFGLKSVFSRENTIKNFLRANRYDLIHINAPNLNSVFLLDAARELNIPVVYHVHNAQSSGLSTFNRLLEKLSKKHLANKIINKATATIAVSGVAAKSWFSRNMNQVKVIQNGIDAKTYLFDSEKREDTRKKLGISLDDKVVIIVARLEAIKNIEKAIDVLGGMIPRLVQKVVLVGEGSQRTNLEIKAATKTKLREDFLFLGAQNDVSGFLAAADLFLLPSIAEGLGLSVVEAQAAGLPVVVSTGVPKSVDVTGLVEFLDVTQSDELWQEKVAHQINQQIDRVAMNNEVGQSKFALDEFSLNIRKMYEEAFDDQR